MKSSFLLFAGVSIYCFCGAQSVAINTDGAESTDPSAMLEIKKGSKAKLKVRTLNHELDTSQIELSNYSLSPLYGTSLRMSLNREEGLLFSSSSDQTSRKQDSIFSMQFNGNRVYFGMNLKNPAATLHIHDRSSTLTSLRLTNFSTGTAGTQGLLLAMNGVNASLVNTEAGNLSLGSSNFVYGGFNSTGNFGVGSVGATERLGVTGNIIMSAATKGIILDGQDRPLITRGFDAFTSGNYTGLGRWGLFMEPSRLTIGIPNLPGKAFNVSRYELNGSSETLLSVDVNTKVTRTATSSADLLPVAYGTIDGVTGTITSGTGNYTVIKFGTGSYGLYFTNFIYDATLCTSNVSIVSDGTAAFINSYQAGTAGNPNMVVRIVNSSASSGVDKMFSFIVYKAN